MSTAPTTPPVVVNESSGFPVAAWAAIGIAAWLVIVGIVLLVRHCLIAKGHKVPCSQCSCPACCESAHEDCLSFAECLESCLPEPCRGDKTCGERCRDCGQLFLCDDCGGGCKRCWKSIYEFCCVFDGPGWSCPSCECEGCKECCHRFWSCEACRGCWEGCTDGCRECCVGLKGCCPECKDCCDCSRECECLSCCNCNCQTPQCDSIACCCCEINFSGSAPIAPAP